jgi:hypothetical protein
MSQLFASRVELIKLAINVCLAVSDPVLGF